MRNVAPSWALLRRSSQLMQAATIAAGIAVVLIAIGLGLYALPAVTDANESSQLFDVSRAIILFSGAGLGVLSLGMVIRAATWKRDNDLAKMTGNVLAQHLDNSYIFIRNISKRRLGYIDAVLIGLQGVLVFRLLDWEGTYLAEVNGWLEADKKQRWVPTSANPTKEVVDDINKVRTYLADYGLTDVPIFGIIVMTKPEPKAQLTVKKPVVPALHLHRLYPHIQKTFLAQDRIDKQTFDDIVDLLYDK